MKRSSDPSSDHELADRVKNTRSVGSSDPIPIHNFHYYRRLAENQTDQKFLEIDEPGRIKQLWRWISWALMVLITAGVFVTLFYLFTNSFRIALVVVTGMLLYMFFATQLAEGKLDKRPGE